jgi:hypothetical protein
MIVDGSAGLSPIALTVVWQLSGVREELMR